MRKEQKEKTVASHKENSKNDEKKRQLIGRGTARIK